MPNIVDSSSPDAIKAAILKIRDTPGLRDNLGEAVFDYLLTAPGFTASRASIDAGFGNGVNRHFGWTCRAVARELGELNPGVFALVKKWRQNDGTLMFTLKAPVVKAMEGGSA